MDQLHKHVTTMRWNSKKAGEHQAMIARLFVDWVGPLCPAAEALTVHKVHEYVAYRMQEKRNASGTINRHLSGISTLVKMACKLELIPKLIEMPWQHEGEGRLRFYSDDEEALMFGVLSLWGQQDYIDLFVFLA